MLMLINKLNVDYYLLNIDIDNQFLVRFMLSFKK